MTHQAGKRKNSTTVAVADTCVVKRTKSASQPLAMRSFHMKEAAAALIELFHDEILQDMRQHGSSDHALRRSMPMFRWVSIQNPQRNVTLRVNDLTQTYGRKTIEMLRERWYRLTFEQQRDWNAVAAKRSARTQQKRHDTMENKRVETERRREMDARMTQEFHQWKETMTPLYRLLFDFRNLPPLIHTPVWSFDRMDIPVQSVIAWLIPQALTYMPKELFALIASYVGDQQAPAECIFCKSQQSEWSFMPVPWVASPPPIWYARGCAFNDVRFCWKCPVCDIRYDPCSNCGTGMYTGCGDLSMARGHSWRYGDVCSTPGCSRTRRG